MLQGVAEVQSCLQDGEDSDMPHAVCDHAAACRARWRRWQGKITPAHEESICMHMAIQFRMIVGSAPKEILHR